MIRRTSPSRSAWRNPSRLQLPPRPGAGRGGVLLLNKDIVDPHLGSWTEADIAERNVSLAKTIAEVWPRPVTAGDL